MKTFIFLCLASILTFSGLAAKAQTDDGREKIYFLADTVNVPKDSRIVKLSNPNNVIYTITFLCKCIEPYKDYVMFSYLNNKKAREISNVKPVAKYLSWEELQSLLTKSGRYFNRNYSLCITEVLPGNRYKTNRVELEVARMVEQAQTSHP